MDTIIDWCCCCCCGKKKFNKNKRQTMKKRNLKVLKQITPPKDREKLKDLNSDPLKQKTKDMTDYYEIPSNEFKNDNDVIKSRGFRIEDMIDEGAFAKVHKAVHLSTGLTTACKKISIPEESKRTSILKDVKNELYILQKIIHPHIIKMIEHFIIIGPKKQTTLYMLMQFASGGNLSKMVQQFAPFSEDQCKLWFAQMLSALKFMHSKGIAHRDLKLANILLDEAQDVLISDFGLSRIVFRKDKDNQPLVSTTYCGTPPYMAPELLQPKRKYIALPVDVWALGIILYKLFNKDYPFPKRAKKAFRKMKQKKWDFSTYTQTKPSPELRDILDKIFEFDPKARPTMSDLTLHPWVSQVYKDVEIKVEKKTQSINSMQL